MEPTNIIPGTGAHESPEDSRTITHDVALAAPQTKGGTIYDPSDIEHQHTVGICTAISRVQLRQKQTGKKYSPDFQYLLQKKFYDMNWAEGSSIFNANKVAKKYGFLPRDQWTHTSESDRYLPYTQYAAKLASVPDAEVYRLIDLCVDPIKGYASVNVSDPDLVAKAICDSPEQAGVLCRYDCGMTWWTPSWLPKDINPLRRPNPATSGHAVIVSHFDYTNGPSMQRIPNTWGTQWNMEGQADINWDNYKMTEAWLDLLDEPVIKYTFIHTMRYKDTSEAVRQLQIRLNALGFTVAASGPGSLGHETKYFGPATVKAVKAFQVAKGLDDDGVVGPMTIVALNQ